MVKYFLLSLLLILNGVINCLDRDIFCAINHKVDFSKLTPVAKTIYREQMNRVNQNTRDGDLSVDSLWCRPLVYAIRRNHVGAVKWLVAQPDIDLSGTVELRVALDSGCKSVPTPEIVEILLPHQWHSRLTLGVPGKKILDYLQGEVAERDKLNKEYYANLSLSLNSSIEALKQTISLVERFELCVAWFVVVNQEVRNQRRSASSGGMAFKGSELAAREFAKNGAKKGRIEIVE